MKPRPEAIHGLAIVGFAGRVLVQDCGSPPLPPAAEAGSCGPQLTAREAALANWTLAASGLRAGKVVRDKVVGGAGSGTPFDVVAEQSRFPLKTMTARYISAQRLVATDDEVAPIDGGVLPDPAHAVGAECASQACDAERVAIAMAIAARPKRPQPVQWPRTPRANAN